MALAKFLRQRRSKERITFQAMSDLHLEVGKQYSGFQIIPRASHLILAGDIGRLADYGEFRDFLRAVCDNFVAVYLVLGNHEFFGVSRQDGLQLADNLQHEPGLKDKLVVLNRRRVDIGSVTLLGCTLHSQIPTKDEEIVRGKINDFRRIVDWTVADHNAEHAADLKWLRQEIGSIRQEEPASARKIVVVTHHAPSTKGTSKPSDENNPWSSAFGTDILAIADEKSCFDDVQWWIFGHTHYSTESVHGSVKLLSNQRGYILPRQDEKMPEPSRNVASKVVKLWANGAKHPDTFDPRRVIEV